MLNRIKILARLRIDEHYSAQDGAIHHITNEGHKVDFRVSIVPTLLGECVALRVLGTYVRNLTLNELGLSTDHQRMITKTSKKPFGMIINTGPAGAGKTTTLYAILKILNRPEVGIITIEDPVEYKIPGIDQIEVNLRTNLTYADGLSSILRQDPNIILVGEIRDKKTAEIAVNAALTGHPLLSSFHANDAATAIPRMVDMGIEPFLLSSVLELVIAQRLVRKLCTHCRHAESVSKDAVLRALPDISGDLIQGAKTTRYTAKGCDKCNDTGYKGRTALFELLPISKEIRELILQRPNSQMIRNLARRSGLKTMFESGLEKVNNGETSLEELIRITSEYEET
jgi:type II secretory ATPase GspE/PulE/Tfp pilus assembly ATPase PilB-like protein